MLFPVEEGMSKTYAGTTVTGSYTEVDTITDVGSSSFLVEVDLTRVRWVETWKCLHEGMTQLLSDGGQWSEVLQGPDGMATIETLSTSGVTIPLSIQAGDSWTQETTFQVSSSSGTQDGDLTYQFKAFGPEEVTVPAGTFNSMRVDVTATMQVVRQGQTNTIEYTGAMWLTPMVGRVKQSGVTTIGGTDRKIDTTIELKAYAMP